MTGLTLMNSITKKFKKAFHRAHVVKHVWFKIMHKFNNDSVLSDKNMIVGS